MDPTERWQCADCHTLVERAGTKRCPTCGHVFFYPVPEHVSGSEDGGSVRVENLDEHVMHEEECELTSETAERINAARSSGGKLLAVGTTSVRTLESAWDREKRRLVPFRGTTDLFIRPGYEFGAVDMLFTNFHTPRSTLLMLVSAFAGRETILTAYEEAVRERYRFFSYGDAMLIR